MRKKLVLVVLLCIFTLTIVSCKKGNSANSTSSKETTVSKTTEKEKSNKDDESGNKDDSNSANDNSEDNQNSEDDQNSSSSAKSDNQNDTSTSSSGSSTYAKGTNTLSYGNCTVLLGDIEGFTYDSENSSTILAYYKNNTEKSYDLNFTMKIYNNQETELLDNKKTSISSSKRKENLNITEYKTLAVNDFNITYFVATYDLSGVSYTNIYAIATVGNNDYIGYAVTLDITKDTAIIGEVNVEDLLKKCYESMSISE